MTKKGSKKVIELPRKVVIGIPHTGSFNWFTVSSLLSLRIPPNVHAVYHLVGNCLVYDARERIVEYALKNDADYLMFLDSDMVPPSDTLIKLLAADEDIVSGLIFKRTPPFQPCFYTKCSITKDWNPILESPVEFPDQGLLPLQGVGMACCLIKRKVLEGVEKPYFFPAPNVGEDLTFCLKARKAGFKIWADLSIDVGHVAGFPVGKQHFKEAYENYKSSGSQELMFQEDD